MSRRTLILVIAGVAALVGAGVVAGLSVGTPAGGDDLPSRADRALYRHLVGCSPAWRTIDGPDRVYTITPIVSYGDRPGEMIVTLHYWYRPIAERVVQTALETRRQQIRAVAGAWRDSGPPERREQHVVVRANRQRR